MSESQGESTSIDLSVDADEALTVFQQLSAAARDADEQIQQLKQHLAAQVTTAFVPQAQQPQTYPQAAATLARMDPAEVAQAAPEIAQTKNALAARSADIQAQAMTFAGTTPNLATQPPADVLAQFQQSMAAREQQQQAQRERQAQQAAAGVERPARYGYDQSAPLAPHPPATPTGSAPVLPPDAPSRPVVGVLSSAPLATTGDDRLTQALTAHSQPTATTATPDAATGVTPDAVATATGPLPQTFEELAAAARAADTQLQDLKQRLLDAFNAIPRGSKPEAASYSEAVTRLGTMDPSIVQELHPDIARTQGTINARRDELTGQVRDFAADNPEAAAEPLPAQHDMLTRWQELLRQHNQQQQQQQAATAQGQDDGDSLPNPGGAKYYQQSVPSGPLVPPPPEGMERLARYGVYGATVDQRGTANPWPAATPAFGPTNGGGSANSNDTTQQDRSDTVLGEHIAQAITRGAGGLVAGGISGAANAAGMGATGDIVAGLARPLIGLLGEAAAPLAVAAVAGGAALGVGDLQAKYATDRQSLAGSVGTRSGATPGSELSTAMHAGWPFDYKESESQAAARQLGLAGVDSSQLGGGLDASMALARHGGIGLTDATALTAQMMQGGMTAAQVANSYAQMDQAARQSGVSVGRLVEGIKGMNQAAGVG